LKSGSSSFSQGAFVNCRGRGYILKRCSGAIENRNLLARCAPWLSTGSDLAQLGMNVIQAHQRGLNCVMQVANFGALLSNIRHNLAGSEELRVKFLLVFIIGADSSHEGSRSNMLFMKEKFSGWSAGDANIAFPNRCRKIMDRLNFNRTKANSHNLASIGR
jgi:hypothetical protein